MTQHVASDTIALSQRMGDTVFGVFFYQHARQNIQPIRFAISQVDDIRPFFYECFSDDGMRYIARDSGCSWVWQLPDSATGEPNVEPIFLEQPNESDTDEWVYGMTFLDQQRD